MPVRICSSSPPVCGTGMKRSFVQPFSPLCDQGAGCVWQWCMSRWRGASGRAHLRHTNLSLPDLHSFLLPHSSRWMRPLQCRNGEKRKLISQSSAAHEPSVLGMAARVAGSLFCAVLCRVTYATFCIESSGRRQKGAMGNSLQQPQHRRLLSS